MTELTSQTTLDPASAKRVREKTQNGPLSALQSSCQHLCSASKRSLSELGFNPGRIRVLVDNAGQQDTDTTAEERQIIVTFDDSTVTITPGRDVIEPRSTSSQNLTGRANGRDTVAKIRESLISAGINPGAITCAEECNTDLHHESTCGST